MELLFKLVRTTGFAHVEVGNLLMIVVGCVALYLAIAKKYEPLLLVPIGFGIIVGNMPYAPGLPLGVYDTVSNGYPQNSVFSLIYYGVTSGVFPPLIFLGIGALTDFSSLISNPKSVLLGAAAQLGIFVTFFGAICLGFSTKEAASIGIIGGADGPTSIFLASLLAPHFLGPIAIAGYSYIALVPLIQPPIMRLLTTRKEKVIRMKPPRPVSQREKVIFPVVVLLVAALVAPGSLPLVGMLMLGNILRESGVTGRLAKTAGTALLDICTILLAFSVGASTQARVFLTPKSLGIFALGLFSFIVATAGGVLFGKLMSALSKEPVNPLIGAAGVSAVPDSARVVHLFAQRYDRDNHLLMHAMAPNVAGVIGSAVAAGVFMGIFR
ncbi:MAG: sodium ion-translocating decarboxylase subunit beta [candidate division KSB1 bacterium]|nr:sodium ion-translocating decarboxylase subunit beta [candidate division KSB1 bacterium]MDZ7295748.1 sodium ion-translocating decarboxylase subunit beta [candidate division KSB1 bacterium]MDZ7385074.1 sodium ion-translocating decarboxylase subunit beta [candidate division KSB1 bacterium]MDZ7392612.1 sodium ion-translocating decarboxylase subunit beta [candidate division KSB1 bacterium]MDZ7414198.1 sodium ion-translocating decarboxylase subunit beta [candidate division KSB1 bacterium]